MNNKKYCEKCGFKNLKKDKFCGGCGNDLNFKPKKKNYAEFFLFLSFIFSWGYLTDYGFGFDYSGSTESIGYNLSVMFWYLVYIGTTIRVIRKAYKKDKVAIKKSQKENNWRNYGNFFRIGVVVIFTFVILVSTAVWTYSSYAFKDATSIFEDAIYGTKQSEDVKYVALLSEIFKGYQQDSIKRFPATIKLDSSNVLEYGSFETRVSLNNSIFMLQASVDELGQADKILREIKESAKDKIRNFDLPEEEKVAVLSAFNKSANNIDRIYLTQRRYQTLQQSYEEMLDLYNFLLTEFNDYFIDFDEYGEENIFFYTDLNIDIYNAHIASIQKASLRFMEAEQDLIDYVNQQLVDLGINIKAEDVQATFME